MSEEGCVDFLQSHNSFNLLVATLALEQNSVRDLLASGVKGILLIREVCVDELLTAIDRVAQGENYISNEFAQTLYEVISQKTKDAALRETLTEREFEVAKLIADGLSSKEIARILDISPATAAVHRRNIMMKTGVNKAAALAKLVHVASQDFTQ